MELKDLVLGAIEQTAIKKKQHISQAPIQTPHQVQISPEGKSILDELFSDFEPSDHKKSKASCCAKNEQDGSSTLFLKELRDKTRLLFHGLRNTQIEDNNKQLELVLSFLEYQLALLEEKLKQ